MSLEVAVSYFMTQKSTVTFVFGLTYCMTPEGKGVIRSRRDLLYDPKGELTFELDLGLKVKHLTWQVNTNVQLLNRF